MEVVFEDEEFTNNLDKFGREVGRRALDIQALVAEVYYEGEELVSKTGTNKHIDATFDELRRLVVSEKITSGEYEKALITTLNHKVKDSFDIIPRGSEEIGEVCLYIGTRLFTILKESRQSKVNSHPAELKMSDIVAGAIRKSRSMAAGAV